MHIILTFIINYYLNSTNGIFDQNIRIMKIFYLPKYLNLLQIEQKLVYLKHCEMYQITLSFGEWDPEFEEFTLKKSFTLVLSSLTLRGWSTTPTTNAARILFAM